MAYTTAVWTTVDEDRDTDVTGELEATGGVDVFPPAGVVGNWSAEVLVGCVAIGAEVGVVVGSGVLVGDADEVGVVVGVSETEADDVGVGVVGTDSEIDDEVKERVSDEEDEEND